VADHSAMKLGKLEPRFDARTLKLARYLAPELSPPPATRDWTRGIVDFGKMANDRLGDCTIAAIGHAVQVFTANTGSELTVPDSLIVSAYQNWCGYDPGDSYTDRGGVEIDVLNHWRKEGLAGHALLAFAGADPQNVEHIKQAVNLFGGVYIGLALPQSAQRQDFWQVVPGGSPLWGGHAVFIASYNEDGPTCITWGSLKGMSWDFFKMFCDEAYAPIGRDWFKASGVSPDGFNLSQLEADLEAVTSDTSIVLEATVRRLAQAWAYAEGWFNGSPNSVPRRANNPGDMKLGDRFGLGTINGITIFPKADELCSPSDTQDGWASLFREITAILCGKSHIYKPTWTIAQIAEKWTTTLPEAWAQNVSSKLGVTPDTTIASLA
jgi:hypothetical protein